MIVVVKQCTNQDKESVRGSEGNEDGEHCRFGQIFCLRSDEAHFIVVGKVPK